MGIYRGDRTWNKWGHRKPLLSLPRNWGNSQIIKKNEPAWLTIFRIDITFKKWLWGTTPLSFPKNYDNSQIDWLSYIKKSYNVEPRQEIVTIHK